METPRLTSVVVWQNGMVMAFDQFGHQMPDFQGTKAEVWPKIEAARAADPQVQIDYEVWRESA